MALNTITLGGKPVYDAPEGVVGLNRFCMRTGASRFGHGAFIMLRSDYDSLVSGGSNAPLVMNGSPGPGLTLTVVVAGAEPISVATGSDRSKDLVKVTVYDQRATNFSPIHKAYNVWQNGFPLDGSNNPKCYSSTLNGGSTWSWGQLLIDSEITGAAPVGTPAWAPLNIIWQNVPSARALDDVAARLFYVVSYDHQSSASIVSSLSLVAPGSQRADNSTLFQQATTMGAVIGGGPALRNLARLPAQITVTFPGQQSGSDPYNNGDWYYAKTVSSGIAGAAGAAIPLPVGEIIAIWNGSAWANQSTLDSIASDLGPRFGQFIAQGFAQYELAGIWPFKPDGIYRQVEWISDEKGARTILKSDNAKDWLPTDQLNDPLNGVCSQEVIALGGGIAASGAGGIQYIATAPAPSLFIVTSATSRHACYNGYNFVPGTNSISVSTSTSQFALSDFGSTGSIAVYLNNDQERGKSPSATQQWDLLPALNVGVNPLVLAAFTGHFDSSDGKPIYTITQIVSGPCGT